MQTLETERLRLRAFRITDLEDFYAYARKPTIGPNAGWPPHTSLEESRHILLDFIAQGENWAIAEKDSDRVIGSLGVSDDPMRDSAVRARAIGYVLDDAHWGKGYMTEAVQYVIGYLFETQDVEVLSIYHYPFNSRSRRVIEKAGFRYEGLLRHAKAIFDGRVEDIMCYSILRSEYLAALETP